MVSVVRTDRAFPLFPLRRSAVAFRVFAINPHTAAFPDSCDLDQAVAGRAALDAFATRAHDGEERFDAVDAIPEKVRMRLFQVTRAGRFRAQNFADGTVAHGLCGFAVTQRR